MFTDPNAPDLVTSFLQQNSDLTGSQALALLRQNPGNPVWCKELCLSLNPLDTPYPPALMQSLIAQRDPIPMTDKQTLKQVRRELMKYYRLKAELMTQSKTSPCLERDITLCEKYIRDTTTPYGIKSFITDEKKAYDAIAVSIRRLLKKAEKECPEAAVEIRKHLKTGRYCLWQP